MAVTELHILMRACERSVMTLAERDDNNDGHLEFAAQAMRNMRMSVLTRTILPLLETADVPDDQLEEFSKITTQLVDSYTDLIKEL